MNPDRVALITFTGSLDGMSECRQMLDLVLPHREAYCNRHGYKHFPHLGKNYRDLTWYYAIQRLQFVWDLFLAGEADAAWVLNIDGVITNPSIPIHNFFCNFAYTVIGDNRVEPNDVVVFSDRDPNNLNAGSFLIRNSTIALSWMQRVIGNAICIDHCWYEQWVMQRLAESPLWQHCYRTVPHPSFNSYSMDLYSWPTSSSQHWQPGHMVHRFPGIPMPRRLELVKEALRNVME